MGGGRACQGLGGVGGHQGRRNRGEGPDLQEKRGAITGEGERRQGGPPEETPCTEHAHACGRPWRLRLQKALAPSGEKGCFLCGLLVARHLLCGLRASGG